MLAAQTGDRNPFKGIDVGCDSAPSAVDWDGDGDLDLIVVNCNGTLSYWERAANGTLAELQAATVIAPRLATLVDAYGTKALPINGVTLSGVRMAHTTPTFLEPYLVPSSGDWCVVLRTACCAACQQLHSLLHLRPPVRN